MLDGFALPSPPLIDPARRLALRAWRPADAPALAAAWAVPDIAGQATVPGSGEVGDAERWIAGAAGRRALGLALDLAVGPADGDGVWGEVGLARLRLRAGAAARDELEIGWWVLPAHRRRGVAVAAAGLLARWAVAAPDVDRVVARIVRDDVASEGVAVRIGLRRRAHLDTSRDLWTGPG